MIDLFLRDMLVVCRFLEFRPFKEFAEIKSYKLLKESLTFNLLMLQVIINLFFYYPHILLFLGKISPNKWKLKHHPQVWTLLGVVYRILMNETNLI